MECRDGRPVAPMGVRGVASKIARQSDEQGGCACDVHPPCCVRLACREGYLPGFGFWPLMKVGFVLCPSEAVFRPQTDRGRTRFSSMSRMRTLVLPDGRNPNPVWAKEVRIRALSSRMGKGESELGCWTKSEPGCGGGGKSGVQVGKAKLAPGFAGRNPNPSAADRGASAPPALCQP